MHPLTPSLRFTKAPPSASIADLPLTVTITAFWMILVDAPRQIQFGPLTLSGAATLLVTAIILCLLPAHAANNAARKRSPNRGQSLQGRIPWPLWGFVVFSTVSFAIATLRTEASSESIQNACVYISFVGTIALAAGTKSLPLVTRGWELMRTLATWFAYLALALSMVGLALPTGSADNLRFLFTPRAMAIVGIIALAIVLPGPPRNRWMKFAPFALVIAMAFSLSRTSTAIGLALLVFLVLRNRRGTRGAVGGRVFRAHFVLAAVSISAYVFVINYTPFRDRFFGGDAAWKVGDFAISTQGRAEMWELVLSNSSKSWLFGHGVGSASQFISEYFRLNHPHNDYLRLYFDFGVAGFCLFLAGYLALMWQVFRNARRTDHPLQWAAFIGMLGIALVAVTDNSFVYPFVMLPLGSLVGLSLALARLEPSSPYPTGDGDSARTISPSRLSS